MFNIFKVITNKNYEIVFLWSRFVLGICVRKCIIKQLPPNKKASDSLRLDHWYKLRDREDKKLILWVAIKDQTKITFWDINGNPLEVRWKMSLFQGWREGNKAHNLPRRLLCQFATSYPFQIGTSFSRTWVLVSGLWSTYVDFDMHVTSAGHSWTQTCTLQNQKVDGEERCSSIFASSSDWVKVPLTTAVACALAISV